MAVIFSQDIIDSFSQAEREIFDNLAKKGKAIEEKIDVKSIIARNNAREKAEREAREQLEAGFL